MGEAAALRAQVGVHPLVRIHFGGEVYDPGQEASYKGPLRASASAAPSSPLAGQPRPQATPRPLRAPPGAPLPAQLRISGPPWARAMGTAIPEPDLEVCAFIIRS